MATVTKSGDWQYIAGNLRFAFVTVAFSSSYATGGEAFAPADVGMRVIKHVNIQPRSGFEFDFDYTNNKILVYRSAGLTPAGTVAVPVVTVTGGQGAGAALQITPDSTSGVLGKTAATTQAIPGATFGIGSQAFTGTAIAAAALVEVANTVDLSTVTGVRVMVIGY